MSKHPAYPPRLVELPGEQDPVGVAPLIRSAITAPGEDTPKVSWRIRDTLERRVEKRSRLLRIGLVVTSVFVAGVAIGAAGQPLWRAIASISSRPRTAATLPVGQGGRGQAHLHAPTATEAAGRLDQPGTTPPAASDVTTTIVPGPSEGTPTAIPLIWKPWEGFHTFPRSGSAGPSPAPPSRLGPPTIASGPVVHAERTPARARPRATSRVASRSPGPSSLAAPTTATPPLPAPESARESVPQSAASATEQALLVTALEKLRTSHDPKAALAALDEHRRRFPAGSLAPEAARLRTEALLLLGKNATVLEELDRPAVPGGPSADERLVLRGELRAAAGRWQAALADFDAVLGRHPATYADSDDDDQRTIERIERALWGRASARGHLGDESGARRDLRDYVRRFPEGRFARQAAHLLEERR